jgi:hypothetical protein
MKSGFYKLPIIKQKELRDQFKDAYNEAIEFDNYQDLYHVFLNYVESGSKYNKINKLDYIMHSVTTIITTKKGLKASTNGINTIIDPFVCSIMLLSIAHELVNSN